MRSYSTPQSALNLEITKLAILESAASVVLYVYIALYFGTFKYLAAAVVMAPLMLFRTAASAEWGLMVYERYIESVERMSDVRSFVLMWIGTPIVGATLRVVGTLYWAVRGPLQTLNEMPRNWLRQTLCTDFFHPPEILPLEVVRGDSTKIPTFADIWKIYHEEMGIDRKIGFFLVALPFLLIGYLPSMIYRVSFKATAIAYAPFVWVAHTTLQNPLPLKVLLERITKGELEKVRRAISWIIIATLAGKLGLVLELVERSRIVEKFPSPKFVESFVVIDVWPWWQITLTADAVLTFFLLYYADAALARLASEQAWQGETVLKTLSTVTFFRAALSVVTISHFFYIALKAVAPALVSRLLGA